MNGSRARVLGAALALVVACGALALLLAVGPVGSASKRRAPLAIGALFSLTGDGAAYGPEQLRGAQLAVRQIDANGGIDGVPLRLVAVDDRSDPAYGAEAMRNLIRKNRVLAVLGPTLSLVALRVDPLANRHRTPVLAVSNTADGIVGRCAYPCRWIWRDSLAESVAVPANIRQFVAAHHPSSAVIGYTPADPLGTTEAAHATQAFRRQNVRVLAKLSMPSSGSPRAMVAKLLRLNPSVLFIGTAFTQEVVAAMRDARAAGFQGAILGGNSLNGTIISELAGRAGAGAQSGAAWYGGNNFPANTEFIAAYRQTYSAAPDQFAAQAYTGVEILASAMRKGHLAGSTAPLAQRRVAIQGELGDTALMTPLGPFRFTARHDVDQIVWVQAMDGRGGHKLVGFCDPGC